MPYPGDSRLSDLNRPFLAGHVGKGQVGRPHATSRVGYAFGIVSPGALQAAQNVSFGPGLEPVEMRGCEPSGPTLCQSTTSAAPRPWR
jgi:hypothetical protein